MIGVSEARKTALLAAGSTPPNLVPIMGLVDTGASCTCLDPSVVKTLGLTPTGSVLMVTPSTGATPHAADQYDISLIIPPAKSGEAPLIMPTLPVMCSDLLASQGFHALIGRDILSDCVMHYNGSLGYFTLAF